MKFTAIFLAVLILAPSALGQTKKPAIKTQAKTVAKTTTTKKAVVASKPRATLAKKAPAKPKPAPTPERRDEKVELDAAIAAEPREKVNALKKFVVDYPNSEHTGKARELLVVARAAVADELLRTGDAESGVSLFKLAVDEAPDPIPEKLFNEIVSKFPYNVYWNGQKVAAGEIAAKIESRVAASAPYLVSLAKFFVSVENSAEALRLSEAALKADPNSSPAHQTIGLAHRLNFDLEKSAAAYAKALELDPESLNSKQSLAEMNRALGKPEEAEKLYREMLAVAEGDIPAQTGLVLSLFDSGKKTEAEAEMTKTLEADPKNVVLLSSAAYWYAGNGNPDKAIELAEQVVGIEPRYVWGYIALARGFMGNRKPVDAERVLVKARSYGNFPTVEYELASARFAAGFYREAAEDLQKQFVVKDGSIHAKLGARVESNANSFDELLADERKASIFTPSGGGNAESDLKLKQLLELHQKLTAAAPNATEIGTAVDEFTGGSDPMKVHRQLYAASALLRKNVALDKVVEVARAATGNTDAGLDAANAEAAVMATELYDSRALAFARNEFLLIPDVPRQTLSAILRGRVEDVAGWALYQQSSYPEAIVRLRRAISVFPDKSAWWRTSMWRLGAALAADGKEKEALGSYIASYRTDKPDLAKYLVVESLYKRLNNGSTEGLAAQIGSERVMAVADTATSPPVVAETKAEPRAPAPAPTPVETTPPISVTAEPIKFPRGVPIDRNAPTPKSEPIIDARLSEPAPVAGGLSNEPQTPKETEKPKLETPLPEPTLEKTEPAVTGGTGNDPHPSKEPEKPTDQKPEAKAETPEAEVSKESEKPTDEKPQADPVVEKTVPPAETGDPRKEPPALKEIEKPVEEKSIEEPKPDVPAEKKEEPKPEASAPDAEKLEPKPADSQPKTESKLKPLFEPIIITIPNTKRDVVKKPPEEKLADKSAGAARERIVEGVEIKAEEIPACKIDVNQENISLINNGGTIGLIVTVDDETAAKQLVTTSSSPGDVEINAEPDLGGLSKQRFYIVKSISTMPGVYQVRLAAACGKKDVIVTVR